MPATININEIFSQVKQLDTEEQFNLVEKIVFLLKKTQSQKNTQTRLSAISGVGSEVWKDVDIDNYVEGERQW